MCSHRSMFMFLLTSRVRIDLYASITGSWSRSLANASASLASLPLACGFVFLVLARLASPYWPSYRDSPALDVDSVSPR